MIHSFSLYFEGHAGRTTVEKRVNRSTSEEAQSSKSKILPFRNCHCSEFDLCRGGGRGGERREASFLRVPRSGSKTVVRGGVGRATTSGVVWGVKNEEDFGSGPFLSLSAPPRPVSRPTFGRRGFTPLLVHAREGKSLDSFCFNVDATAGENRLASTCSRT